MNIQALIANLSLEEDADRSDAAEDLGYSNSPEAVAPLVEALRKEPSRKVREAIFLALERIDSAEVPRVVIRLLESEDAFLRNQTVALLQQKGAAAVPVLLERMQDTDPDVRKFVLDAAAEITCAELEPIFECALRDTDSNIVITALEHLGEQRKAHYRPQVEGLFSSSEEPMLVCAAFSTLLRIGNSDTWKIILARYPNPSSVPGWELGFWIRALGDFGALNELDIFSEILRTKNGKHTRDTVGALERFQGRHGRIPLSEGLWHELRERAETVLEPEDKLELLRVLGGFSEAPPIGEFMMGLLDRDDRITRLAAIEGLKRLGNREILDKLVRRSIGENDPEVAEALSECQRAST